MPERGVLFLAVGGTRRRGVVEAASRVVAAGGRASVVVGDPADWAADPCPPQVEILALWPVERRRPVFRFEQGLLAAPGLALRAVGRTSAQAAYRSRVADRIHRRLTGPAIRATFGDIRHRLVRRHTNEHRPQVLIIADAPSVPLATRLLAGGTRIEIISFDVQDAVPARVEPAGH
jgi:hypothetical protein